jgi:hypothetical protein
VTELATASPGTALYLIGLGTEGRASHNLSNLVTGGRELPQHWAPSVEGPVVSLACGLCTLAQAPGCEVNPMWSQPQKPSVYSLT